MRELKNPLLLLSFLKLTTNLEWHTIKMIPTGYLDEVPVKNKSQLHLIISEKKMKK